MNIGNLITELEHEGFFHVGKGDPNVITLGYKINGKVVSKAFRKKSSTLEDDIRQFQKNRKISIIEMRKEDLNKDFQSEK